MRVKFVDVDGVRTRYYEAGDGPMLLLIHGAAMAADVWIRTLDPLADRFRVVAPDLLGNGFTGAGDYRGGPPHPYYVRHLFGLLDAIGIDRFAAAGSSLGALIAALLYFEAPRRVTGLVFVGSGSTLTTDEALMRHSTARAYANGRTAFLDMSYEDCRRRMNNIVADPGSVPESLVLMQLTANSLPGALDAYDVRMQGLMDIEATRPYRVGDRLGEIDVPVLAVLGRNDPRGRYEQAVADFARLPMARIETMERCGHYPQLEHPEEFNAMIRDFLAAP